jgi:hypothetical protein
VTPIANTANKSLNISHLDTAGWFCFASFMI